MATCSDTLFHACVSLPGDKLSWQRAVLRSILRRQAVERELLLQVLQDPGFGDLVEAAAGSMEPEERWQRLAQLAEKHQNLNLSTPGKCFFFLQFYLSCTCCSFKNKLQAEYSITSVS